MLVGLARRGALHVEEADLLRLRVRNRCALSERIEIIIAKPRARTALSPGPPDRRWWWRIPAIVSIAAPAVGRSRDHHNIRVGVVGARIVGERDPALDVDLAGALIE